MSLYTRKEYEEDCKRIDKQIAISASLLGERLIGPLQHEQRCVALEECKRKLGMKLAMSAIAISDKKRTEKSGWFAWVIGAGKEHESTCPTRKRTAFYCNCNGPWYLKRDKAVLKYQPLTNGKWRDTTLKEIYELQNRGVTVMESFPRKKLKTDTNLEDMPEMQEGTEMLQWEEVDEQTMKAREQEGEIRVKDGKSLWYSHWMVRREGEFPRVRYYTAKVG